MNNKYFYQTPVAHSIPFDNNENDFESETTQEAIEEVYNNIVSRLIYPVVFGKNGNVTDAYLNGFQNIPSDESPIILPLMSELIYVTFSNSKTPTNFNIHVYKTDLNHVEYLIDTFNIINQKTWASESLNYNAIPKGWGIQVRIEHVSGNVKPSNVVLVTHLRAT